MHCREQLKLDLWSDINTHPPSIHNPIQSSTSTLKLMCPRLSRATTLASKKIASFQDFHSTGAGLSGSSVPVVGYAAASSSGSLAASALGLARLPTPDLALVRSSTTLTATGMKTYRKTMLATETGLITSLGAWTMHQVRNHHAYTISRTYEVKYSSCMALNMHSLLRAHDLGVMRCIVLEIIMCTQ